MNKSDRRTAYAALLVALVAIIALFALDDGSQPSAVRQPAVRQHGMRQQVPPAASKYYRQGEPGGATYRYAAEERRAETFPFDPNSADSTQLLRLGFQPWQVRSIYRFRARGGVFRRKEDFARLHWLTAKDYQRLEPYIHISKDYLPAATLVPEEQRDTLHYPVKLKDGEQVALNTADTAQLKRVPGIGDYYAKEILRHGRWLGGYVSVDQLDEIDGFPQEAKRYFVIDGATPPAKLNINRLSLQQLRRHPYINYYQAKTIVDHRRLHGDIKSLDDLRLSRDFPPEVIQRLEPYVCF